MENFISWPSCMRDSGSDLRRWCVHRGFSSEADGVSLTLSATSSVLAGASSADARGFLIGAGDCAAGSSLCRFERVTAMLKEFVQSFGSWVGVGCRLPFHAAGQDCCRMPMRGGGLRALTQLWVLDHELFVLPLFGTFCQVFVSRSRGTADRTSWTDG